MKRPKTVDAYIVGAPKATQPKLKALRRAIRQAAPAATEKISYGMPYYGYRGRLAYFAYAKAHIGLYLMPPLIQQHKKELAAYQTSKATIRFPLSKPLPLRLIERLIRIGVRNNERKR